MISGSDGEGEEDEEALWSYVTRDIEPLSGREVQEKKPPRRKKSTPKGEKLSCAARPVPDSIIREEKARDLDRRTDLRLRRGQMEIEARLDLHGMNRAQAHLAVREFVLRSYQRGLRHILLITGKGGRSRGDESKGVLRQAVPGWLNEAPLAEIVLQFAQARPQHGGEGAIYILLRRRR
ncbi:MAG: Smr/MutS family protein [Rhodospirillales bacterium]|nr:Smr/MutS family protein [Rhodospirillales bacterium]MCB9997036.1 Smr/MutS family protein [Rhodospirillales bacterium]